jgi:hypothetical protein
MSPSAEDKLFSLLVEIRSDFRQIKSDLQTLLKQQHRPTPASSFTSDNTANVIESAQSGSPEDVLRYLGNARGRSYGRIDGQCRVHRVSASKMLGNFRRRRQLTATLSRQLVPDAPDRDHNADLLRGCICAELGIRRVHATASARRIVPRPFSSRAEINGLQREARCASTAASGNTQPPDCRRLPCK